VLSTTKKLALSNNDSNAPDNIFPKLNTYVPFW
jgi:hypothetical protein